MTAAISIWPPIRTWHALSFGTGDPLADGKPVHLGHLVKADARWRLIGLPMPPIEDDNSRLAALFRFLETAPGSPVRRFTPPGQALDSVIDRRAVLQQGFREINVTDLPPLLRPAKENSADGL